MTATTTTAARRAPPASVPAPAGSARPQRATARYARRPAGACAHGSARAWASDPAVGAAFRRATLDDGLARSPGARLRALLAWLAPAGGTGRAMTDPNWGYGLLAAVVVLVFLCFVLDLWWRG